MSPFTQTASALFLSVVIFGLLLCFIPKKSHNLRGAKLKKVKNTWKLVDYVWYFSAFATIAIFAVNHTLYKSENKLNNLINEVRSEQAELFSITSGMLSFCDIHLIKPVKSRENSLKSTCNGISLFSRRLVLSLFEPGFPMVDLKYIPGVRLQYQPNGSRIETNEYLDISWENTFSLAANRHKELRNYEKFAGNREGAYLPATTYVETGKSIENKIEQIKALKNQIDGLSYLEFQGAYWIYFLSVLIAFKMAKTRAEIVLG